MKDDDDKNGIGFNIVMILLVLFVGYWLYLYESSRGTCRTAQGAGGSITICTHDKK